MAVVLGAQVSRADDWNGDGWDDHPAVPVQQQGQAPCGPRPTYAPQGQTFNNGHYELQNVQRWVPGQQQQVWVQGQCYSNNNGNGRGWGRRHHRFGNNQQTTCTQGYYRTVWSPGRYETTQQWVWVANTYNNNGYYGAGFKVQNNAGTFSMQVY
ncbi:MAG: hypothetical protein QM817_23595 [Archangium sp.]